MAERVKRASELTRVIERAAEKAMGEAMRDLQGRAQRLAPIDTGDLRASAQWAVTHLPGGGIAGGVAFPLPYAAAQHEGVGFEHPRGGEAKFLERPLKENADRYAKHIADSIEKAIEGAGR